MASFTNTHRFAYHVVPLQALKPIWESKALFSKGHAQRAFSFQRKTTAAVDAILGFKDYVHFYLPRGETLDFSKLSILSAQIGESQVPAFPHIVLVIDTGRLTDDACTVCNFNIAVSRPSYGEVKPGNHTRGTSAKKILKHWHGFRAGSPDPIQLRYGEWVDGFEVPVLNGESIARNPQFVGRGSKSKVVELLIRNQYDLHENDKFYCFSAFDLNSASMLPAPPQIELAPSHPFEWYASENRVALEDRRAIERFFAGTATDIPSHVDCDRIRKRPKRPK